MKFWMFEYKWIAQKHIDTLLWTNKKKYRQMKTFYCRTKHNISLKEGHKNGGYHSQEKKLWTTVSPSRFHHDFKYIFITTRFSIEVTRLARWSPCDNILVGKSRGKEIFWFCHTIFHMYYLNPFHSSTNIKAVCCYPGRFFVDSVIDVTVFV